MAGLQIPSNSVWSSMNYVPPRGPCNFKNGLVSGICPCLRFMLHPVKAATSFECDGCGHHASYHSLENPKEDAILQKWSEAEKALAAAAQAAAAGAPKNKRRRITQHSQDHEFQVTDLTGHDESVYTDTSVRSRMPRLLSRVRTTTGSFLQSQDSISPVPQ